MTCHPALNAAIALSLLALASCGESTPTQPGTSDQTPIGLELAVAANSWTMKAKMPTARFNLAAGVVNNSSGQPILYAIGGSVPTGNGEITNLRTVEAYNFATDTWRTKAALPLSLDGLNGVGVIGGKLYVSGGSKYLVSALYVHDPGTNTWTPKANMPQNIRRGVTGVINGKLYVLNGYTSYGCDSGRCGEYDPALYRYDPATDTWDSSLPKCPGTHLDGAGAVISGKFYVAGGRNFSRKLHVYDPVTNRWSEKALMARGRWKVAGAQIQNQFYVIGGTDIDGISQRLVEAYNPATNTWVTKAPMPTRRSGLAAARVVFNGQPRIIAVGGVASAVYRATEAYTP